jgi:hypothetical protein
MTGWVGGDDSTSLRGSERNQPIAWWIRVAVILGAALTAMGGIIALVYPAMLVSPHDEINGAVRIYAGYLVSRNLAIAILLMASLVLGARRALGNLMFLVGLIQLIDVCMDVAEGRWAIVPGILVFGIVFLVGAARLCGYPFWRTQAWTG